MLLSGHYTNLTLPAFIRACFRFSTFKIATAFAVRAAGVVAAAPALGGSTGRGVPLPSVLLLMVLAKPQNARSSYYGLL